jgi:fluoride exporter
VIAAAFLVLAGAGALARAFIGHRLNRAFPTGTLLVNASGSFALGLLSGASPAVITAVGTGGLGAYTTFSSFARDAVALIEERRWGAAAAYVLASLIIGVAAAAAGISLSRGSW